MVYLPLENFKVITEFMNLKYLIFIKYFQELKAAE